MAAPESSLSIAVKGFADFLSGHMPSGVSVSVDTPQGAAEAVKGAADTTFLNVFVYRLAPSGVHPGQTAGQPLFVRASALLSVFSSNSDPDVKDSELRVLGHAMSVLGSHPVLPDALPPGDTLSEAATRYRLEAVLQAPSMEELNHIWTTQGGELAYRLSAAYELALIPLEPLAYDPPPGRVAAAVLDIDAAAVGGPFAPEPIGVPPVGAAPDWLPVIMFRRDGALLSRVEIPPGAGSVDVALIGPPGRQAALSVDWTRAGAGAESQEPQIFPVTATRLDADGARLTLALDAPAEGDSAVIRAVAAQDGGPVAGAPPGNALALTVAEGPG